MWDVLHDALSLLWGAEFFRFVESGLATAAVHYGIFWICYRVLKFHYQNATTTGMVPAFVLNFLLHKFWTYGDTDIAAALVELPLFSLKQLAFWYLNRRLLFKLVEQWRLRPLFAQLLLIPTLGVFSYLILRVFFKP